MSSPAGELIAPPARVTGTPAPSPDRPHRAANGTPAGDPPVSWTATANSVSFAVSIIATFFLSPFVIGTLGDERYGTWTLIAQLTGYYALLDFGTRSAVGYFVARLSARGEQQNLSAAVSTAFLTLSAVGTLIILAGASLAFLLPSALGVPVAYQAEARSAMVVLSVTIGLTLPFDVWAAAVNGCRRAYIVTTAEMLVRIATSIGIAVALSLGGGLVALACTQLAGKAVVWTVAYTTTRRLLPDLSVRPAYWSRSWLTDISRYGGGNFVINVAAVVINRLDLLIVGTFLGMAQVTYYAVAQTLTFYVSGAVANLTQAFTMHFTHLHSIGDGERLRKLYMVGVRIAAVVAILTTVYVMVFGSPFLRLWLGERFVTGDWRQRSDIVLFILLSGRLPFYLQGISRQLLLAARRIRFLSTVQVGEALANVTLSLLLVQRFGLAGVAIGTLVPTLVSNVLLIPPYVLREIGIGPAKFFSHGIGRSALAGLMVAIISWMIARVIPPIDWGAFFTGASLAGTAGLASIYAVVLNEDERARVRRFMERSVRRFR